MSEKPKSPLIRIEYLDERSTATPGYVPLSAPADAGMIIATWAQTGVVPLRHYYDDGALYIPWHRVIVCRVEGGES